MRVGGITRTHYIETGRQKRDMKAVLCMNGGSGEESYANNSFLQRKVIESVKSIRDQAIIDLCSSTFLPSCLRMADFGCSSGPNALIVASEFITAAHKVYRKHGKKSPKFQIYLNDLPMNDFNTVFKSVQEFETNLIEQNGPDLGACFVAGVPGSFYGRLFPSKSLHFVHSSSSLHWLSQVPEWVTKKNGRNIYLGKDSPPSVIKAFYEQFKNDFALFLKSRSKELVIGGRMVFSIVGRESDDPTIQENGNCYVWDIVNVALNNMVSEGLIEEEKLVSFNVPFYSPSAAEIVTEVSKDGSFTIDKLEGSITKPLESGASNYANLFRAASEPLLSSHFGKALADEAFLRYREILVDHIKTEDLSYVNITLSMTRKA